MPLAIVKKLNPLELGSASTLNPVQWLVAIALFYSALLLLESGLRISTFIFLLPTWLFELTWVSLVLRVFYSAPSCRYPCLLFDSNVILLTNPVVSSDFRLFHVTQIQKVTRWNTRGKP